MSSLHGRNASVYRCFDAADRLLYIGISDSIDNRMRQHRQKSPWFGAVTRVVVGPRQDRRSALAEERQAIVREKPLHNQRRNFLPLPVIEFAGPASGEPSEAAS